MSLQGKIQVSQAKIVEWFRHFDGKVCLSFSGGKDSTVLADLTARVCWTFSWPLTLVFADTGLEYPEVRQFVPRFAEWLRQSYHIPVRLEIVRPKKRFDEVIETRGYPIISKETATAVQEARRHQVGGRYARLFGTHKDPQGNKSIYCCDRWSFLYDAPFLISADCCRLLKKEPLSAFQKKSGLYPLIGTMAVESRLRTQVWLNHGCNAFEGKYKNSTPLSFWCQQDILAYLLETRISFCPIYGDIEQKKNGVLYTTGAERTGCMFCCFGVHLEKEPNRFQRMKITHPKQWHYCIHQLGFGKVLDYIHVPYQ